MLPSTRLSLPYPHVACTSCRAAPRPGRAALRPWLLCQQATHGLHDTGIDAIAASCTNLLRASSEPSQASPSHELDTGALVDAVVDAAWSFDTELDDVSTLQSSTPFKASEEMPETPEHTPSISSPSQRDSASKPTPDTRSPQKQESNGSSSTESNALSALNMRMNAPQPQAPVITPDEPAASGSIRTAPLATELARARVSRSVPDVVLGSSTESEPVLNLNDIPLEDNLPAYRTEGGEPELLTEMLETPKFRDRWAILIRQLALWGHSPADVSAGRQAFSKHTTKSFSNCNSDLLYHLPAREVHLLAKKFKLFAPRSLDRKIRAASSRVMNLYVDFEAVPGFNGSPVFRDVVRLLFFVSTSEFNALEQIAPGIVGSANNLLPEIMRAAVQPPAPAARTDHAMQLQTIMFEVGEGQKRREMYTPDKRRERVPLRQREERQEDRVESLEQRLASRLRGGKEVSRPWTPWDEVTAEEDIMSQRNTHAERSGTVQSGRGSGPTPRRGRGAAGRGGPSRGGGQHQQQPAGRMDMMEQVTNEISYGRGRGGGRGLGRSGRGEYGYRTRQESGRGERRPPPADGGDIITGF